jgi:hypothetical protein
MFEFPLFDGVGFRLLNTRLFVNKNRNRADVMIVAFLLAFRKEMGYTSKPTDLY